jgi:hypothetical protein
VYLEVGDHELAASCVVRPVAEGAEDIWAVHRADVAVVVCEADHLALVQQLLDVADHVLGAAVVRLCGSHEGRCLQELQLGLVVQVGSVENSLQNCKCARQSNTRANYVSRLGSFPARALLLQPALHRICLVLPFVWHCRTPKTEPADALHCILDEHQCHIETTLQSSL